jgi:hypothetical protein
MTNYHVLLVHQKYAPAIGYYEEYTCVFFDADRQQALKEMRRYVKQNGFAVRNRNERWETVKDVVLRAATLTGEILAETPYCKLFDEYGEPRKGRKEENT